jgi:F-type H+-transporting ATPase subunit b
MTVRHAAKPVIIRTGPPQATDAPSNEKLLDVLSRPTILNVQQFCRPLAVAILAMLVVSSGISSARGSEDGHATAEHHSHGEGHSEIGANPPPGVDRADFASPAEIRGDLAIWSFAVFLLLMFLLTAVAWKPIMNGLDAREQSIAEMVAATQTAHDDAKKQLVSYERRLAEAAEEVKGMLDEARRDAETTRQSIVSEARQAADEEKHRAKREIELARDDAIAKLAEKAGELAVGVAGKFIQEKITAEDQSRLVRESIAGLSTSPSVN